MRRVALFGLSLLLAVSVFSTSAEAGTYRLSFRNHKSRLSPRERSKMNQYIRMGCRIFQFSGQQTNFIRRAVRHVFSTLNDGRFQKAVKRTRFTFTRDSGMRVFQRIIRKNLIVSVWGYRGTRSCRVGRHANAFHIYNTIYINRDYLMKLMRTGNWRRLAHTLAHEMMHDLGYGHGRNEGQAAVAKKRSVPIKVGCWVQYWRSRTNAFRACP
ncbi:MAG: hypothetical protein H6728_10475 [Myxococcales bacterium]|nr:hypothetical protein [Myxococcales bacterium]MCB9643483.1 hypothetical protein [Myxococcales bacterium]